MSLKSLGIISLVMILYFFMYTQVGITVTTGIVAIFLLLKGIYYTIKPVTYEKHLKKMNPKMHEAYLVKGELYFKKQRKVELIMTYVLAVILGSNAFMQYDTSKGFEWHNVMDAKYALIILLTVSILMIIAGKLSLRINKNTKSFNEELISNIVLGVIVGILCIAVIIASVLMV